MTNPETAVSKDIPQETPLAETPTSRRNAAALLGILGAAFVSGCASRDGSPGDAKSEHLGTSGQALSQSDFYWFDDVSSLLTTAGSSTYMVAVVGGYHAVGDGGGGIFFWDSGSVADPNGGTIFQEGTTSPGRWKRLYSGAINVRWFGAKGDDSTPDDAAFTNAIAALAATTSDGRQGVALHIPAGKYKLEHTLHFTRPTLITGEGGSATEHPATDLRFVATSGSDFAGLLFDGPAPGTAYTAGSVVRNLAVTGRGVGEVPVFHGIQMNMTVTVQNCFIRDCKGSGIRIFSIASELPQNADMWRLDNVFVENCGDYGLFIPRNGVSVENAPAEYVTTHQDHTLGVANQLSTKTCQKWGVWDEGESANSLYMSCNSILCGMEGTPPTGGSYFILTGMLLNCYADGGQAQAELGPKGIAIGGTYGNPNPNPIKGLVMDKSSDYNLQLNTGLQLNAKIFDDSITLRGQDGLVINRPTRNTPLTDPKPDLVRLNNESGGPLVRFDYDGQVGIGVAPSAGARLKVFDTSGNGGIEIGGSASSSQFVGIKMAANEAADGWKFIRAYPHSASSPYTDALAIVAGGNLLLNTDTLYGGNVGVGIESPTSKFHVYGDVDLAGTGKKIGFMGATPIVRPTVTGSKGGNAALASLLTQLANLGLITDSST